VHDPLQVLSHCLSTEFVEMHTAAVGTNRLHVNLGIAKTLAAGRRMSCHV
jgi:hypothetical protein